MNTFSPSTAPRGRYWKISWNKSASFAEYLARTSPSNPYILFIAAVSWLPRVRLMLVGSMTLYASSVRITSTLNDPRSTKSPLNRYGFSALGAPFKSKMLHRSKNWPCTSPHTVKCAPSATAKSTTEGSGSNASLACMRISNAYFDAMVFCSLNRAIISSMNGFVIFPSSASRAPSYAESTTISLVSTVDETLTISSSGAAMASSNLFFRNAFSHSLSFIRPSRSCGCIRHTVLKSLSASAR
mmetsp:Transcript_11408/g.47818  ORF Transcript_11408/g.47818 Transcript_11408/m.47818 type:complete len:242 (+) Transcript_11408:1903-2628(+)